ncbi:enolase C-terminal domain-like protein [Jiangella rhizosphaerae]|uniref:Mandelate racemase/muconate lactonizing enzyme C-terminal domain-containing protein n=1 Tax=Jiangella rhizosphaerae TaxID=2293569 RepID=A0A418KY11_9ACTN|nr:enolase C-terminal domain-like protein [Jiangella rhizosphaerae]RIQ37809.1 hypothetical protein DY240_00255 [Jiangella rhizosphaerae]
MGLHPGPLVTAVETRVAPFSSPAWLDRQRISTPLGWFPEHAEQRSTWRGPGADLVWVLIRTDDPALYGIGQTRGGMVAEALIARHLAGLLVGTPALEPSRTVAILRRAAAPYAAGGTTEMAVGACELALWDLAARAAGLPLFRLLGGRDGPLPYYVTCADPAAAAGLEPELLDGAHTVKVPMAYGPADGAAGFGRNVERVAEVRSALPAGVGVSVDCFMSWDVPYATRFAAAAAPHGLDWIEEPLAPDDVAGHAELRARCGPVRIAGGEHTFGLRAGAALITARAVDVLQCDVTWCGGLTVARTLAELAAEHGVVFAPHASGTQPWALHLLAAAPPGALAEVMAGVARQPTVPRPSSDPGVGVDPAAIGFAMGTS